MLTGADCSDGVYGKLINCENTETIIYLRDISIMEHSQSSTVIEDALNKRKEKNIDPFKSEFFLCGILNSL